VLRLGARVLVDTKNEGFSYHENPKWEVSRVSLEELCSKTARRALPSDVR
jgi:hypothetical protein